MTIFRVEGFDTLSGFHDYKINVTEGKSGVSTYNLITGKDGIGQAAELRGNTSGTNALLFQQDVAGTNYTSCTIGFWAKIGVSLNAPSNDWYSFAAFYSGASTRRIRCQWNRTTNEFRFLDESGSTYATSSAHPDVIADTWHFYEVHWTRDATSGFLKLWIDGVEFLSFSGNTSSGGTANTVGITAGNYTLTDYIVNYFDHLYISNDMASLYPCEVITIPPTADVTTQWDTSSGTVHFSLVDELPLSSADYITVGIGGGNNLIDRFSMTPAGYDNGGDILAFSVAATGIRTSIGTSWAALFRVGGFDTTGTAAAPGDANERAARVLAEINPDTSLPWEWADLEATDIGVNTLATNQGRRVYAVHGLVLATIPEQTETETPTPSEFPSETETVTAAPTETETETTTAAPTETETETVTAASMETETPTLEETETPEAPRLRVVSIMVAS